MNHDQFSEIVFADPNLAEPVRQAARAGRPQQFGPLVDAAVVVLMFPIARYILASFALPWLHELKRYSELERRKIHEWIDEKYREEGFDPDAAEAASNALCDQLEQTTDADARLAWERLREMVRRNDDVHG